MPRFWSSGLLVFSSQGGIISACVYVVYTPPRCPFLICWVQSLARHWIGLQKRLYSESVTRDVGMLVQGVL
jgi:hypothetical protein